jgi:hypothetical protein
VIILALKEITNPPNAFRFIQSIRAVGYDINQAVAELIDNSITYGSKNIKIDFFRLSDTQNFAFMIADDGKGMDRKGIINAMKFGSDCSDILEDLGKYGMGLKISSFSQCRKFTTVSVKKNEPNRTKFWGCYWDIDHVEKRKDWKMVELEYKDIIKNKFVKESIKKYNTIILWEKIDKIDEVLENAQRPERIVGTITGKLEKFIRMTYHRFLDGSLGKNKTVTIILNDIYLKPWDPFCQNEKNTDIREKISFELIELPNASDVLIEPYILPNKDGKLSFSDPEVWKDAKGLLSWNDSQGYYIYRGNRLIQFGGWLGTREKDEHTKYARIAISFNKEHDEPFRIALNKTKSTLPPSLFEFLRDDKRIKKVLGDAKARGGADKETKQISNLPLYEQSKEENHQNHMSEGNTPPPDQKNKQTSIQRRNENNGVTIGEKKISNNPKFTCSLNFTGNKTWLWDYKTSSDNEITISVNEKHPFFEYFNRNETEKEQLFFTLEVFISAFIQTELDLNGALGIIQKEKIEKISQNLTKIVQRKGIVI